MNNDLTSIFYPNSIAIVGVSIDPRKLSSIFFTNLIDIGYRGKIYPVNPKYKDIYGYKCYSKVSDIEGTVDQVAILIPANGVLDVVKDCVKKKVNNILIISAGFGESSKEGKLLEKEIVNIAKSNNIRILGPNIIGVVNTPARVNSSWMQLFPKEGNISFLSQSGAFCTAILDISLKRNLGFYNFCSIGNKADINELDLIKHWYSDERAEVIGAYLEEISNGYSLLKFLNIQRTNKPVVLLKPGKTKEAIKAIASHTGSLAGTSEIINSLVKQSNSIEVNSSNEMLDDLMTFSWSNLVNGNRVAVITNAGGPAIMATDALVTNNLVLASLENSTKEELKKVLPSAASINNPIDILGDASADRYQHAADIILNDNNVDILLFILTPQYITEIEDTAKTIIRTKRFSKKPIFAVFIGQKYVDIGIERLHDAKVPVFNETESAAKAISDLYKYSESIKNKNHISNIELYENYESGLNKGKYIEEINKVVRKGEIIRLEDDLVEKLALEVGFNTPSSLLTNNIDEAKEFLSQFKNIVIKIPNKYLSHKTEENALRLNIKKDSDLEKAFNDLNKIMGKLKYNNKPLLLQEMIDFEEELFIGSNRDGNSDFYNKTSQGFGHILVYGQGGIYTEIYKDLVNSLIPIKRDDIETNLKNTKLYKILNGARGLKKLPIDKVLDSIMSAQKLVNYYPSICSLDINPLLITKDRVVAVDIKVYVG